MYISEKFVYTELHKTAGTHIGKWLKLLTTGEQIGKHNRIPPEQRDKLIFGSIRNPWDWYVSLWAYGCDNKGSVWYQTTDKVNLRYCREQLPREMNISSFSPLVFTKQVISDLTKPTELWKNSYKYSNDPANFKLWLKLMFNNDRKFDIREGFGFSPISNIAGVLTYRFLKLFTNLDKLLYSKKLLSKYNSIEELWGEHSISNYFIRMEHLEEDLIQALLMANIEISQQNTEELIAAKTAKTNTSSRKSLAHYYDDESIQLVYNKEQFLIKLFEYSPPSR